jgi:hypothetical protein
MPLWFSVWNAVFRFMHMQQLERCSRGRTDMVLWNEWFMSLVHLPAWPWENLREWWVRQLFLQQPLCQQKLLLAGSPRLSFEGVPMDLQPVHGP